MNVQPKPSPDCTTVPMPHAKRLPGGPRGAAAFTWESELSWSSGLEVDPWRP